MVTKCCYIPLKLKVSRFAADFFVQLLLNLAPKRRKDKFYAMRLLKCVSTCLNLLKVELLRKERTNERKKAHFRIKHRIHCLHARSLLGSKAEEKESLLLLAASKQEQGQSVVAPTLPEKYTIMVFFSRCLRLRSRRTPPSRHFVVGLLGSQAGEVRGDGQRRIALLSLVAAAACSLENQRRLDGD